MLSTPGSDFSVLWEWVSIKMAELNQKNEHTPPLIGKMGRYTAFIKPPHITARPSTASPNPKNVVDLEAQASPAVATPP